MVDKRLKEIHTSSSAESAINVEMLDWLKNQGPNVLLGVLVVILAFRVWMWWGQRQTEELAVQWDNLNNRDTAASLISLAEDTAGIGSLPELAKLKAAEANRRAINEDVSATQPEEAKPDDATTENPTDPNANTPEPKKLPLTAQERAEYLAQMETLYTQVYDATRADPSRALLTARAAFGLAAVGEMRGDFDMAAKWYTTIESTAINELAPLGRIARERRETMQTRAVSLDLPTDAEALAASGIKPPQDVVPVPAPALADPAATPAPENTDTPPAQPAGPESPETAPAKDDGGADNGSDDGGGL